MQSLGLSKAENRIGFLAARIMCAAEGGVSRCYYLSEIEQPTPALAFPVQGSWACSDSREQSLISRYFPIRKLPQ